MKTFLQSALLATFLLVPAAAWAGNTGSKDGCKCEMCEGKDGKCDKQKCACEGDCTCKKEGSCGSDCGCDKKHKK